MSNKLFITGDKHGNMNDLYRTVQKTHMDANDILVILGDFRLYLGRRLAEEYA